MEKHPRNGDKYGCGLERDGIAMAGIEYADLVDEVVVEGVGGCGFGGFEEALGFGADVIAFGGIEDAGAKEGVPDEEGLFLVHFAVGVLGAAAAGLLMGLIAEVFNGAEEFALDGDGGATAGGNELIPDLADEVGVAEVDGEDGLGGGDGVDFGFGCFPALHDVADVGGCGVEPAPGIHPVAVLLIEIGAKPEDLSHHAEISGAVRTLAAQEPALDSPVDNIGAVGVADVDVGAMVEHKIECVDISFLLRRDVQAVVAAGADDVRVGAFFQKVFY